MSDISNNVADSAVSSATASSCAPGASDVRPSACFHHESSLVVTGDEWASTTTSRDLVEFEGIQPSIPDRAPPWLCAFLLVAYCSVFWIGLITTAGWIIQFIARLSH